jgi:hypothetical protein
MRGEWEVVITGRKIVEGASLGGMLGMEKRQCLRIELKTRNWHSQLDKSHDYKGKRTCHANGRFLRFASTSTAATIRE